MENGKISLEVSKKIVYIYRRKLWILFLVFWIIMKEEGEEIGVEIMDYLLILICLRTTVRELNLFEKSYACV